MSLPTTDDPREDVFRNDTLEAFDRLQQEIAEWANVKGWRVPESLDEADLMLSKLMLVVSEISEATEEVRKQQPSALVFVEELADATIRMLHICAGLGLNLGAAVEAKMDANWYRPFKHGKRV